MIEVIGIEGSPEVRAAAAIKSALENYWPGIGETPAEEEHVKIVANVKLAGYKVSDIDVVIAAKLGPSRYVVPKLVFNDRDGNRVSGAKVRVRSLVAAVEVKDQDANGIEATAGGLNVRYKDGWKSATDQNDAQRYALLEYFSDFTGQRPWVYRCVFLQGVNDLPKVRGRVVPNAGAIASRFDVQDLVMAMARVNGVGKIGGEYAISSCDNATIDKVLDAPLFTRMIPSLLDRAKMDRVAARPAEARALAAMIGEQRVHLRGEGGTGKTVLLAQAAHEAYKTHGKRSLFLTFNHALAADIQRILALMNVPSSGEDGGVDVRTVMSFVYSWLAKLGILEAGEDIDFDRYAENCQEAMECLETGVVTPEDLELIRAQYFEEFDYDAILVDEAQDWPQPEADLVTRLYGGERICIADGVSQLVRGRPTNWRSSDPGQAKAGYQNLDECLRMKANLAVFANAVAERAGMNWEVVPSTRAGGGRVIIRNGPYKDLDSIQDDLDRLARQAGNAPIDFLFCVPSSEVGIRGNSRTSELGGVFLNSGKVVWDAVDPVSRQDYPRSIDAHRILQYKSCRGLEGWVVVLDGFDEFWRQKYEQALNENPNDSGMLSAEQRAAQKAWRWAMIPLTRAIDTLVITTRDPDSTPSRVLSAVANEMIDFVEKN